MAAKWRLAAAYQLAGQPEAARALAAGGPRSRSRPTASSADTYGSDLRDRAMVLEAVVLLGLAEHVGPLAKSLSESLSKNAWLSTQETAYALLALSKAVADPKGEAKTAFSFEWNGGPPTAVTSPSPVVERALEVGKAASPKLVVRNTGTTVLYPRLILSGLPPVGRETAASNGFSLEVQYLTPRRQAARPVPPRPGHRLQGGGEGDEPRRARGLPRGRALAGGRVGLGDPQRPARPEPRSASASAFDYQDVRDDRVYTYFDLKAGETKTVEVAVNASYLGRFYLPMVTVEAMYDATLNARAKGQWVEVVAPGQ